jgi:hypothetical protein
MKCNICHKEYFNTKNKIEIIQDFFLKKVCVNCATEDQKNIIAKMNNDNKC